MLQLGRFVVDLDEEVLLEDGMPRSLRPAAWRVLALLVRRPGELWRHDELIEKAWSGANVVNDVLTQQIRALRRVLGREAIATVRGRGYRLELAVRPVSPAPTALVGRDDDLATLIDLLQRHGEVCLYGAPGSGRSTLARAAVERWPGPTALQLGAESDVPRLVLSMAIPDGFRGAVMRLGGLSAEAGRSLARRAAPQARASDAELEALSVALGGHPAALVAFSPYLRVWPACRVAEQPLPSSLTESFEHGWRELPGAVRRSLECLASIRSALPAPLAREILDVPGPRATATLEETADHGWLDVSASDESTWVAVATPLGRWIREHVGTVDGDRTHRQVGQWLLDGGRVRTDDALRTPDTPAWSWFADHQALLEELLASNHLPDPFRAELAALAHLRPRFHGRPDHALFVVRRGLEVCPSDPVLCLAELALMRATFQLEAARRRATMLLDLLEEPADRLVVESELVILQTFTSPGPSAREAALEVLRGAQRLGDPLLVARAHFTCARAQKHGPSATEHFRAALRHLDPRGWQSLSILANLGQSEHAAGRLHEAEAHFLERLEVPEERDRPEMRIKVLQCLGDVNWQLDRPTDAERWLEQSRALAARSGWVTLRRASELGLADLAIGAGDLETAGAWIDRIPAAHEPDDRSAARRRLMCGLLALRSGRIRQARLRLSAEPIAIAYLEAVRLAVLAGCDALLGDVVSATSRLRDAGGPDDHGDAWFAWARAAIGIASGEVRFADVASQLRAYGSPTSPCPVPEMRWLVDLLEPVGTSGV